jgi:hypothetical protein
MVAGLVKSLLTFAVKAFEDDQYLHGKLKARAGGDPDPIEAMLDVFEEEPEITLAQIEESFYRLPAQLRLTIAGVKGVAEGILGVHPRWRRILREQREKLLLAWLRSGENPERPDPMFLRLADALERHPRVLKALTDWILAQLGV